MDNQHFRQTDHRSVQLNFDPESVSGGTTSAVTINTPYVLQARKKQTAVAIMQTYAILNTKYSPLTDAIPEYIYRYNQCRASMPRVSYGFNARHVCIVHVDNMPVIITVTLVNSLRLRNFTCNPYCVCRWHFIMCA